MKSVIGHILRMSGLLTELIGVWAIFTRWGGKDATRISFPGGTTAPIGWLVVALGFVLWFTGSVLLSLSRRPRPKLGRTDDEVTWSGQVGDDIPKPGHTDDKVGS
jgi:hypothetical protein